MTILVLFGLIVCWYFNRCLCWERCRSEVPDLMISDSEKGVARLVLEKPDSEDQSTDNQEQNNYASSLHESTQVSYFTAFHLKTQFTIINLFV